MNPHILNLGARRRDDLAVSGLGKETPVLFIRGWVWDEAGHNSFRKRKTSYDDGESKRISSVGQSAA
jgi:hypothetical protein